MIAPLLAIARKRFPSLENAIADGGYQGKVTVDEVQEQAGIPLEIVKRSDMRKGFQPLPKRWIAERTYGWPLSPTCQSLRKPHSQPRVILTMIRLMLRRIVRLGRST